MPEVNKNTFAKIALLVLGIFVTTIVVIIAIDVSRQTPPVVNVVNAPTNAALTNAGEPIIPIQPSQFFAATGTVTAKQGNALTVTASVHIDNELTDRVYTVQVTPNTVFTQIDRQTTQTKTINFGNIAVNDTITFRAEENLAAQTVVTATLVDKLIN